jgi:hypothetical protein
MNGNTTGTVGVCCVDGAKRGEIRKCNVWTPIVFFKVARNCRTQEEKADYLELASRLSTLANSALLMPNTKSPAPQKSERTGLE